MIHIWYVWSRNLCQGVWVDLSSTEFHPCVVSVSSTFVCQALTGRAHCKAKRGRGLSAWIPSPTEHIQSIWQSENKAQIEYILFIDREAEGLHIQDALCVWGFSKRGISMSENTYLYFGICAWWSRNGICVRALAVYHMRFSSQRPENVFWCNGAQCTKQNIPRGLWNRIWQSSEWHNDWGLNWPCVDEYFVK